ncbi:MAG TPA: hypothetical protein VG737_13360, partial [Cyclobacteriaceae bacterium]|nr:hypothetical protein [Cyclobacteriaceae bacterium]
SRKSFLIDEVNAMETVYLRADFLPDTARTEVKSLMRRYVDIRIELPKYPGDRDELLKEASDIRGRMWAIVDTLNKNQPAIPNFVSFVASVNDVFTINNKRITAGLINELPNAMWFALYVLTAIAMMGFGYLFGMSGKLNWPVFIALAMAYATIICLIVDLDKSSSKGGGVIRISYKPLIELQEHMKRQP